MTPVALLPAAGASRRMGCAKLLLPWPDPSSEQSILGATLTALRAGGVPRLVVVSAGNNHQLATHAADLGAEVVRNPEPDRGMLSSIQVGLSHLLATGTAPDPLLVCPADLPRLAPHTVAALLATWRAQRPELLLPVHLGRRGHPLLVGAAQQSLIFALDPVVGLRQLLDRSADCVHSLSVDDPGVLTDVDTPQDLPDALLSALQGR